MATSTAAWTMPTAESGLAAYLKAIRQFPMLEPQEEYMLARRRREHGDRAAAQRLVTTLWDNPGNREWTVWPAAKMRLGPLQHRANDQTIVIPRRRSESPNNHLDEPAIITGPPGS